MNARKFYPWLLAAVVSMTVATPVLAQDYYDHGRDDHGHDDRGPDHGHHDDGPRNHRGGPPDDHRDWHRGDRYDGPRYVVEDYRRYDLPPPPDDRHRWVRNRDGDFILIAVTTGIITDLLLHR